MELIALILSGLALLAATVCLYLTMREKKRNQERNAAMLKYTDKRVDDAHLEISGRVEKLEQSLDPEAVRKAAEEIVAQAVNDVCEKIAGSYSGYSFGMGINNIMNFDPKESMIRQREKERMGE